MAFPSGLGSARPSIDSKSHSSSSSSSASPARARLPFRGMNLPDHGWASGSVSASLADATRELGQPRPVGVSGAFTSRFDTQSIFASSSSSHITQVPRSDREGEGNLTLMANSISLKRGRAGQEREAESDTSGKRHHGVNRHAIGLETALPDSQLRDLIVGGASGPAQSLMEGLTSKVEKFSLDDEWESESESEIPKRLAPSLSGLEGAAGVWRGRVERYCAALQLEEATVGSGGPPHPMAGPVRKLAEAEKLFRQRWLPARLALENRIAGCDQSIEQIEVLQADAQLSLRDWQSVHTRISEVARQWRDLRRTSGVDRPSHWVADIAWENREQELMLELLFPITLDLELELHFLAEQHDRAVPASPDRVRKGFFDISGLRSEDAGRSLFNGLLEAHSVQHEDEQSLDQFRWEMGGPLVAAYEAGLGAQSAKSRLDESFANRRNVRLAHGVGQASDQDLSEAQVAVQAARQESRDCKGLARVTAAKMQTIRASSPELLKRLMIGAEEYSLPFEAFYQKVGPMMAALRRDLSNPSNAGLFDFAVDKSAEAIQAHINLVTQREKFLTAATGLQQEGVAALGHYEKVAVSFSNDLEICAMTLLDARLRWQDCARASALGNGPVDPRLSHVIGEFDKIAAAVVADFSTLKRETHFLTDRERVTSLQVDQPSIGPALPTALALLRNEGRASEAFTRPDADKGPKHESKGS